MSEHRWSRLRFSPLRLTTAAVFGSIDCALQFHSASSTTPPRRFGCRYVPPRHLRSVTARGASLHLRLQTIFTLPFPLYPRHLRLRLRCRVRFHSSVPRNLRLLFRPVRTGICSPSSNRRTAAIRHHPPTHKRTDERTDISPWHSLVSRPIGQYELFAKGSNVGGFRYRPTRNVAYAMAFDRSIRQSLASPVIAASEHFWPRFRCSPLRLKNAASFGSRDYDLRLAIRCSPKPLLRHGVGRVCLRLRS